MGTDFQKFGRPYWPIAAVIPVFITGHPVIMKWGNYNTFNIPTFVLKDIQQM